MLIYGSGSPMTQSYSRHSCCGLSCLWAHVVVWKQISVGVWERVSVCVGEKWRKGLCLCVTVEKLAEICVALGKLAEMMQSETSGVQRLLVFSFSCCTTCLLLPPRVHTAWRWSHLYLCVCLCANLYMSVCLCCVGDVSCGCSWDKIFADHVTHVCKVHNRVIVSFLQQVQGGTRPTTEGSRENIGHTVHVWGDRERNTRL